MATQLAKPKAASRATKRRKECRVYERISCDLVGSCQPASAHGSEEAKWPAAIRNIGQGGVCLVLKRRYERGAGLAIELPSSDGQKATFFAKVIYVRAQPDGQWVLGCQFVSPLSEEELGKLLPADKIVLEVRFQLLTPLGTMVDCLIKDLQLGQRWPLAPGTIVTLRGGTSTDSPWSLKVEVIRCSQQEKRRTLQCRLPNPPSAGDVLRALSVLVEDE
ncbi:MAG TPA: PilZ domain-containing protein [Gemmataceae bacterium]|nr:PilZ domain-containing protein [Gemmataceae bacterium]